MAHPLWVEDGRTVAWSWLRRDGTLEHDVHPDHLHLLDEILAEPAARTAAAFADDEVQRGALARHGFAIEGDPLYFLALDLPHAPTPPPLADGLRYRTVGEADVPERVAIHRAVWSHPESPSRGLSAIQPGPRAV